MIVTAATAYAATGASDSSEPEKNASVRLRSAGHAEVAAPVWLEHSASFRLRSELLVGGNLGNGASAVPVPLLEADGSVADGATLAWSSIRFRYDAAIHVGQPWTIHLGIDALDNLVMGSTHVNAGGTFDDGLWRDSQGSPSKGVNSFSDALEVRHVYATWRVFEYIDLRVGRMPEERALGIWRQAGLCPDCDYGTYVDGAQIGFELFGFQLDAGWEVSAAGATSELPGVPGQPKNLDVDDDVMTWTVGVGRDGLTAGVDPSSPLNPDEQGAWVFDWSLYAAISGQELDTSVQDPSWLGVECAALYEDVNGYGVLPYDCWRSVPRGAEIYRPGGWFRAKWRPSPLSSLRLELELSAMVGEIERTQASGAHEDPSEEQFTRKDLSGFGGVFELEYQWDRLQTGFDFGFATGDNGDYLGVEDGQNINVPNDENYLDDANRAIRDDTMITSFWFHRDYHIDLLLFRQIIGTVTNAVYVRPWLSYTVFDSDSFRLGARLDVLYAAAANPQGTPGDGKHWGVEMDGSVWMDMPHGFGLSLHTGVLMPLDALNDPETGEEANPAFALRGLFSWRY